MNRGRRCLLAEENIVMETETAGLLYTMWSMVLLAVIIFSLNISYNFGLKLILVSAFLIYLIKKNVDSQELILTDRRIIHCNGRGVVREIEIEEIETMSIAGSNGLQGNLKIVGRGSEVIKTHWIADPVTFNAAVSKQIQDNTAYNKKLFTD